MLRSLVACALPLAGCFGPDAREGLRCSADGDCPPGQDCYQVEDRSVCLAQPPSDDGRPDDGIVHFGMPVRVELPCPGELPCISPRDPSLTDDLTQIAFAVQPMNAETDLDVYLARRGTKEDVWPVAVPAGAIDTTQVEEGSWMTGNGLTLTFSRGALAPPYGELWVSERLQVDPDGFETSAPVSGVVNTLRGDERSGVRTADATALLFARALETAPGDHDLYLARDNSGQWDTVVRLPALSLAGSDERSVALVEGEKTLFVSRDERIFEARWTGDDIAGAEVIGAHDELQVVGATLVSGVWAAADGSEIWFGACSDSCDIYRAIR